MEPRLRDALQLIEDRIVEIAAPRKLIDRTLIRRSMSTILARWTKIHQSWRSPAAAFKNFASMIFDTAMSAPQSSVRHILTCVGEHPSPGIQQEWLDNEAFVFAAGMDLDSDILDLFLDLGLKPLEIRSTILMPEHNVSDLASDVGFFLSSFEHAEDAFLAQCGSPFTVAALCARTLTIQRFITMYTAYPMTPDLDVSLQQGLQMVSSSGDPEAVQLLVTFYQQYRPGYQTISLFAPHAFEVACAANNLEITKIVYPLISHDPIVHEMELRIALLLCCKVGVRDTIYTYLLDHGAYERSWEDFRSRPNENTGTHVFELAIRFGNQKLIRLLDGWVPKAEVFPPIDSDNCFWLWAVYWQDIEMVQLLCDLDIPGNRWWGFDMISVVVRSAIQYECDQVVEYLINRYPRPSEVFYTIQEIIFLIAKTRPNLYKKSYLHYLEPIPQQSDDN